MIKAIIFDWGGTLVDTQTKAFYPDAIEVVKKLAKSYRLALLSICPEGNRSARHEFIRQSGLRDCFKHILLVADASAKFEGYLQICEAWKLSAAEVAIIDDRVVRGIAWGNEHGAYTVWIRQGTYANERPNAQTGMPRRTVLHILDLLTEF